MWTGRHATQSAADSATQRMDTYCALATTGRKHKDFKTNQNVQFKPGHEGKAHKPSHLEAEAEGSKIQGPSVLQSEPMVSPG